MNDSSGARVALVGAFDLAQRARVTELFDGLSPVVKRILDVTGLSGVLPGPAALHDLLSERGVDASTLRALELASDA